MYGKRRIVASVGVAFLTMVLLLSGCASSNPSASSQSGSAAGSGVVDSAEGSSAAVIADAPLIIDPGFNPGSETRSDIWIATGDENSESLYFARATNPAGLSVIFVDADGVQTEIFDLETTDEGHLVSLAGVQRDVDISFEDNFTCYDSVTDTTYTRGEFSQAEYEALFAGNTYSQDPEDLSVNSYTFNEDGTFTHDYKGSTYEGTWSVVNTSQVRFEYDSYNSYYGFEVVDGAVAEILEGETPLAKV